MRDRRDSGTFHLAARALRRRAAGRRPDCPRRAEDLALAGALDAAARDVDALGVGLRSSLVAVSDAVLQAPDVDPDPPGPSPRRPGALS